MQINLPNIPQFINKKNILLGGMGGGFDIFCGLPLYFELRDRELTVHLANISFSDIENLRSGERLSESLVGVQYDISGPATYFPELYLTQWYRERLDQRITVWCFHKTGAAPLLENYRLLTNRLAIDAIILIDGGVDSLLRGDEEETGTLIEDSISLYAVNELSHLSPRIIVCLGFGSERDVAYTQILENIAGLTKAGGFFQPRDGTPDSR